MMIRIANVKKNKIKKSWSCLKGRFTLLFLIIIFTNLFSQVTLIGKKSTTFPKETKNLFDLRGKPIGYWTSDILVLLDQEYSLLPNENYINIFPFYSSNKELFLSISVQKKVQTTPSMANYTLTNDKGNQISSWQIKLFSDQALPSITPFSKNQLILSYPEDQSVVILDQKGNTINKFTLFKEPNWNHEKTIKVVPESENSFLIAGMASARLTESNNISLFRGFIYDKPEKLFTFHLTVLYDFMISTTGYAAISGTVSDNESYNQVPKTILFSLNDFKLSEYPYLPKQILWQNDLLYAADANQLLILSPDQVDPFKQISFGSKIIPIKMFKADSYICFLYSNSGEYHEKDFFYHNINLLTLNVDTFDYSFIQVSPDKHKIIQVSPIFSSSFRIQLDNDIFEYRIE